MARNTFIGGIHPYEGRELSKDREIRTVVPSEGEMAFPLRQHTGRPSVPVVAPGDRVWTGRLIAKADGELSSNLHSSVSGRVAAIEEVPDEEGKQVLSILIDNDGRYDEPPCPQERDYRRLSRETLLSIIRDAGIVGLGGSGVPTHYKLRQANEKLINIVIANGIECEPYRTGDYRRLLEDPWKVINGLMILLRIFPRARGIIAVSESNRAGYRLLRSLLINNPRVYVQQCRAKYPQGSERQLIHAVTGRSLNAKMLPCEIGCMVLNTDTLVAVSQAVVMHEPLITRIITVSGPAAASPCNLRVRCGQTYREVLVQAGGLRRFCNERNTLLLDGGPLTGHRITNPDAPVTKLSSAITCIPEKAIQAARETPCIRCRRCSDVCPSRILPMQLIRDVKSGDKAAFVAHGGLECCDCGSCSYICPAALNLTDGIGGMKRECLRNPQLAGDYTKRLQR